MLKKEESFGHEKVDCLLYTKSFFGGLLFLIHFLLSLNSFLDVILLSEIGILTSIQAQEVHSHMIHAFIEAEVKL